MALVGTTLNGAISATDSLIRITSGTSVAVGRLALIDSEIVRIDAAGPSSTQWYVNRGLNGTAAVAHNSLSPFVHGDPADFLPDQKAMRPMVTYGAAGAVAIPSKDSTILLNSGGASAMTLADPGAQDEGRMLTVVANTAHAYTLSNAAGSGFNGAGAAGDVGTFGGAVGDNIVLLARGGKWYVVSAKNVTLA
jgi:hypothetical protein